MRGEKMNDEWGKSCCGNGHTNINKARHSCYNGPGVLDMDFDRASPMPHLRLMLLMWMDYTWIRYSYGMDTMRQRLIVTVP